MEAVSGPWTEEDETNAEVQGANDESDAHFVQDAEVIGNSQGFQDDHIGSIAAVEVQAVLQREMQAIFQEMQIRVFNYVDEKLQEHRAIWRLELVGEFRKQLARTSTVLKDSTDVCSELLPSLQRCGFDEASHCEICLSEIAHSVAKKSFGAEQAQELSNCRADSMQHAECFVLPEHQSRSISKATLAVANIPVEGSGGRLEVGSVGAAAAVRSDALIQELQRLEGIVGGLFSPQERAKAACRNRIRCSHCTPRASRTLGVFTPAEVPQERWGRRTRHWRTSWQGGAIISEGISQERTQVDTSPSQSTKAECEHFFEFWGAKQTSVANCVAVELGLADDMAYDAVFADEFTGAC